MMIVMVVLLLLLRRLVHAVCNLTNVAMEDVGDLLRALAGGNVQRVGQQGPVQ